MTDTLGDRMKNLENAECDRRFMPLLPIMARVDGRAFHSFTRGMNRPYDTDMSTIMIDTMVQLAKETNSSLAYTQSDEITFTWYSNNHKSQIWFDGRITKMTSQLAALATLYFNNRLREIAPQYLDRLPTFDARVWQVPNKTEAANVFLWREWDATKNSISMAASSVFSDKELFERNGSEKQEMLFQKGINWNNYPIFFKRGTYAQKKTQLTKFSTEEIEKLPPKHEARINPNLQVERNVWTAVELPIFETISNKEKVVFEGAEPILAKQYV